MRYGVYGGSFDPVHLGHVAAAEAVFTARGFARVVFVPAASPPHKRHRRRAPLPHRAAMLALAVAHRPAFEVDDLEGRRAGPSYTFDTLRELREKHAGAELELMVGADMLEDLPTWYRADELVAETDVVAFARPGWDTKAAQEVFRARFPAGRVHWVEMPPVDASSTEARRRVRAGEPLDGLVAAPVAAYIRKNGLYREGG